MRSFTYLIGSTDDFSSSEDLHDFYLNGVDDGVKNYSTFGVTLSEDCHVEGYRSLEELATIIARGEAMSDGWCLDDTVSVLVEE